METLLFRAGRDAAGSLAMRFPTNDKRERSPWGSHEVHTPDGVFAKPYPTISKRIDHSPVVRLSNLI
jgi:hypothetical protein